MNILVYNVKQSMITILFDSLSPDIILVTHEKLIYKYINRDDYNINKR